ncbi:hypothetical protein CABS01_01121 [Colletotrichum abscissum]|uniref:uncharacterized protein n=1 Tax=Colletotrichum abscissum TaxID=1671311 RepID=UPI0027D5C99B|nr:uncharacterized protein CABS01_01121 [Colletotrichum abscissum]KAK1505653.1 hypothetical protein CABS01_01121 [Colletotrichum abscissum]
MNQFCKRKPQPPKAYTQGHLSVQRKLKFQRPLPLQLNRSFVPLSSPYPSLAWTQNSQPTVASPV